MLDFALSVMTEQPRCMAPEEKRLGRPTDRVELWEAGVPYIHYPTITQLLPNYYPTYYPTITQLQFTYVFAM